MAWLTTIVPMLQARFPGISDADILKAHAYAYGGSVIQDIGYYPFGSHYYSDLLHYVRTGDFVAALIRESTDPNEYAFALGALAHYNGDVYGHPAVNQVTADEFPKLRRRFGRTVTYDEDKTAHLRTEFGFDVVEVAHGRYSQQNYRDFIGFQVAKPLLERAFQETYGIPMSSVMKHEDLAIATYRKAVSSLIPHMTEVAVVTYKAQIEKESPGFDKAKFVYRLRRTEFEQAYGTEYLHPGLRTRFVAFVVEHLPKIGPLRALKLSVPNAAEQATYVKSINTTVDHLKRNLAQIQPPIVAIPALAPALVPATPVHVLAPGARDASELAPASTLPASVAAPASGPVPAYNLTGSPHAPDLAEIDLDTGKPSHFGEYRLADLTYARLLNGLLHPAAPRLSPDVQQSLRDFYDGPRPQPAWYRRDRKAWATLQADLIAFDRLPPAPVAPSAPAAPPAPAAAK